MLAGDFTFLNVKADIRMLMSGVFAVAVPFFSMFKEASGFQVSFSFFFFFNVFEGWVSVRSARPL